ARSGWLSGIATGKSARGLKEVLAVHGIEGHFVTRQTADHHPSKPHPAMLEAALAEASVSPENAVMVGDTSFDMEMARSAGVRAIGVSWGYHTSDQLIASGAASVLKRFEDLVPILCDIWGHEDG
ncbi:MAG: HAD-IA family hydrolase, partial [Pseudomonadota bacterium]